MMYPKTAAQSCSEFSRAKPGRCGALKLMRRVRAPSRFTTQLGSPGVSNTECPSRLVKPAAGRLEAALPAVCKVASFTIGIGSSADAFAGGQNGWF